MAEWLRRGLQILARRFDSGSGLHFAADAGDDAVFARSMIGAAAILSLAACGKPHGPVANEANSTIDAAPIGGAPAAPDEAPMIRVSEARVASADTNAAVYLTIDNQGGADRLIAIDAGGLGPVTLHQSSMADGVMRMRALPGGIAVTGHGQTRLAPMGLHAMVEHLAHVPRMGDVTTLTLHFERQGDVKTSAITTSPSGAM